MSVSTLQSGDAVNAIELLVEKRSEGIAKNGKPYLNLTLRDKTGSIGAKLWSDQQSVFTHCQEGRVVTIHGAVEEYQGNLQLRVSMLYPSSTDPGQFVKRTPFDVEMLWADLFAKVTTFQEPLTKFVIQEIFAKPGFTDAFKKAPAAKSVHNAWVGGLIEHVHSLVHLAEPVIVHYQKLYRKELSRDKVLFGLMLHDAAKIIEYDATSATFNYTTFGKLVNHMVMGPAWVYEAANRFPTKDSSFRLELAHLMHILASHHGCPEWGSPMRPSTLEAILVHHLDNLDAKFLHALDFVKGKEGSVPGFSDWSRIEETSFYQG